MSKVSRGEVSAFISNHLRNVKVRPTGQELADFVNEHFGTEYSKESISGICSAVRKEFNEKCDKLLAEGKDREKVEEKRKILLSFMPELKRGRVGGNNGVSFADSAAAELLAEFE